MSAARSSIYTPEPFTFAPGTVLFHQDEHRVYKKLTWRGSIDHRFSDELLAYASISRGFKSGVYNSTSVGTPVTSPPVAPETLDAYEIGFKSDFLDRQIRLNVSGFYYGYKDIQLFSIVGPTAFLVNAAAGRLKGLDIESKFAPNIPFGKLTLTANVSLLDAKYTRFPNAQFFYPRPALPCGSASSPHPLQTTGAPTGGNLQCVGDASGNRMIKAPKIHASTTLNYVIAVGEDKLAMNISWSHNSGYNLDPDQRIHQKAFDLINAQLAYRFEEGKYTIRGFIRNIQNANWKSTVLTSILTDFYIPGDPRSYRVALDFKF